MRTNKPRITPVDPDNLTPEQKDALAAFLPTDKLLNIFATLANASDALKSFLVWGNYILSERNSLSARDRELVILRAGFNCRSGYEWTQHAKIGQMTGLSAEEIERIKEGPDAAGWEQRDSAMLRATDDLTSDFFVSEKSWIALSFLDEKQKMDLVFTVGQYTQVSMILNSFGIQLEDGLALDPELDARNS